MLILRCIVLAGLILGLGLIAKAPPEPKSTSFYLAELFGARTAQADASDRRQARRVARRTARRTARRIERRQDYIDSLSPDCVAVVIAGSAYWLCDSVYYREIIEDGVTVYVIANP